MREKIASRAPRAPAFAARALAVLLGAGVLSCNLSVPDIRPPPFGPDVNKPAPAQLFFPTGLAAVAPSPAAPAGLLLVVNGNFDRSFNGGTVVSLDLSKFHDPKNTNPLTNSLFQFYPSSGPVPGNIDIPRIPADPRGETWFAGAAMIGTFGGPLAFNPAAGNTGGRAYTASRDTNLLNGVQVAANGALSCIGGAPGAIDCRGGVFDTYNASCPPGLCAGGDTLLQLEGPYGLAIGTAQLPGSTAPPRNELFVMSLIPHIDTIINSTLFTRAQFAALNLDDQPAPAAPGPTLFYGANASDEATTPGGVGVGAGPVLFDAARRRLIVGGCYLRFGASNGSTPSSGKCGFNNGQVGSTNLLRFISVDEGSNPDVQYIDLTVLIQSAETTGLALGGKDANGIPQKLYATMRNPDLLVEMDLSSDPGSYVSVSRATALPVAPAGLVVIERPAALGGDLIAVVGETSGSVSIYDTTAGQVVANLENLGMLPFSVVQLPPQPADTAAGSDPADPRAHLAVTMFYNCRIALLDVPLARPWKAALRATVGSCQ